MLIAVIILVWFGLITAIVAANHAAHSKKMPSPTTDLDNAWNDVQSIIK